MQTRKDLYQAHRLMMQRMGTALLQAEPDVPEAPMRRQNVGMFAGILVAVLIMAGFGIWGLLSPGNATKLTEAGQLLVEEESGAKYVYSQQQKRLLPVANYVSARLLLDANDVKVRNVTAKSLAGFSRGPLVGIAGAPDSLPAKDKLVKGPWSACVTEGTDAAGGRRPYVSLVGGTAVGGRPIGGDAMIVMDAKRQAWVIWADRRMQVSADGVRALGVGGVRTVPASWLNAIPVGGDFSGPRVPGLGKTVKRPDGPKGKVGQVFTAPAVAGSPARYFVLVEDGYAPISVTQATLLMNDRASKAAYGKNRVTPLQIDAATANAYPSKQTHLNNAMPATMPKVISPPATAPLCAVYADTAKGSARAKLTVGATITINTPRTAGVQERFDQVLLPPGTAAVVAQLPGETQNAPVTPYYLLTDQGRKFALAAPDQLAKFGYDETVVTPVPSRILHQVPDGPKLDPVAAKTPVEIVQ
ncbi:type VII secretion protein EccB [Nonomuraea typhae]|uniref:type VII secretion protein EccB n=1 Tax=Nonomuraea typhae TaxID=2603600 RepID=UPI0012F759D6|nr:type VII secretion protein EccB [Nonomuraea typhae]